MKDFLYLSNILESINLIKQYLRAKTINDLKKSVLLKDAVCKRIEEIGENMKKLTPKITKEHPEVDWVAFIETRNFLTHVYQMVNLQKLWSIMKKDIPILEKQIKEIIKDVK